MPNYKVEGFQGIRISMRLIPELMISPTVAHESHMRPHTRNKFGNRGCIGESGFDPVELWVMGPPCGLKV